MSPTIFTRAFDQRVRTLLGVLGFSVVLGGAFGTHVLWQANMEQGYQPVQPLPFKHSIMAGKHEINCVYCHTGALSSAHAGIPTVTACMKCHKEIQTKDSAGELKVGLALLNQYWEKKEPIPWVKVHDLSDFVYFDHSRHLQNKDRLWCQDCHGAIEKMDVVYRQNSLKMGWCLDCHMKAPDQYTPAGQATLAPIHCSTCHR